MLRTLIIVTLSQLAAQAAPSASVSSPSLGYTLTGGHLVRFTGIPGAAQASADVSGAQYGLLRTASAAPIATLLTADSSKLLYIDGDSTVIVPLPDRAVNVSLSPTGNYFLILYSSLLQLFNRAGAPIVTSDLSTIPAQPTDIADIAVTDQGEILLVGSTSFWYSAKNAQAFTHVPMALTFARFMPHDHLIIAYDSGQGRIIAVHPASAFAVEPLITGHEGLTTVTGLQFGADGTSVWVSQDDGSLLRYDLPIRNSTSFSVPGGVLSNVLAPGVFIWNQPNTTNVILDTTQPTPAVLVVPAANGAVAQ